jgi:hypothetical protein
MNGSAPKSPETGSQTWLAKNFQPNVDGELGVGDQDPDDQQNDDKDAERAQHHQSGKAAVGHAAGALGLQKVPDDRGRSCRGLHCRRILDKLGNDRLRYLGLRQRDGVLLDHGY